MTRAQFDEYSPQEQDRIKKILKYSKIEVEAAKRKGISRERVTDESNRSARHRMPGEGLRENQAGYSVYESSGDIDEK